MSRCPRILIIGNYPADLQQSMARFAALLVRIYQPSSQVSLVLPPVIIARLPGIPALVRKYLAYIDKLVLFPLWLFLRVHEFDLVHIADHSNAFYAFFCFSTKTIVTCHDLLAVRGAMGDHTSACSASIFGIWLQRLVMAGLRRSDAIAFVSHATFCDYERLGRAGPTQRYAVIPNPLNAPFTPDAAAFELSDSELALLPPRPYLLMVGSALPRKNRALTLQLLQYLGECSPYTLVFAGDPLTSGEQFFRLSHPLGTRIRSISRPSHALLNWLYCHASALLFPSFAEGFGWPIIEAQTCGCPVIASSTTSIPEVAGAGALYADPMDVGSFAAHVHFLEDPAERARMIRLGLNNTNRYASDLIEDAYRCFAFQL
jgi:glycosyltransferase involved in cell wall biosynthesis